MSSSSAFPFHHHRSTPLPSFPTFAPIYISGRLLSLSPFRSFFRLFWITYKSEFFLSFFVFSDWLLTASLSILLSTISSTMGRKTINRIPAFAKIQRLSDVVINWHIFFLTNHDPLIEQENFDHGYIHHEWKWMGKRDTFTLWWKVNCIREIRINFNCKIVKFFYNKTCFLKMLFSLSI